MKPSYKEQILEALRNKENIRNFSIVAHIDHGKTTLSDHLLAAGKLMSSAVAGDARALDYMDEEQSRGITIKTANISFVYDTNEERLLYNLIDTPGHIDFSISVSQALRLVDGTLVVVDAVEGIMAQTESVLRQALNERVKPILFINKIDRLITELKLDTELVEQRVLEIADMFNSLIQSYRVDKEQASWKVSFADNSLILGSAIDGWAISMEAVRATNHSFDDITNAYQNHKSKLLSESLPLAQTVLHAIAENLPSPITATEYRTKSLMDEQSKAVSCDSGSSLCAVVGKLEVDRGNKIQAICRIFSGSVKVGEKIAVYRPGSRPAWYRVNKLHLLRAQRNISVPYLEAGAIGGLGISGDIKPGDTISAEPLCSPFKSMSFIQEPVIQVTVEPHRTSDVKALMKFLEQKQRIDPGIVLEVKAETGEITVTGLGELQLEILLKEIEDNGIAIYQSEPSIARVEQIEKSYSVGFKDTQNGISMDLEISPSQLQGQVIFQDRRNNSVVIQERLTDSIEAELKQAFKVATFRGPLSALPLRGVCCRVSNPILSEVALSRKELGIVAALTSLLSDAIVHASPYIAEPFFNFQISTPTNYLGNILALLEKKRATITDIEQNDLRPTVEGTIWVRDAIGLTRELRAVSEGYAFWQLRFGGYAKHQLDGRSFGTD